MPLLTWDRGVRGSRDWGVRIESSRYGYRYALVAVELFSLRLGADAGGNSGQLQL
jgi:hypothetical protein